MDVQKRSNDTLRLMIAAPDCIPRNTWVPGRILSRINHE